MKINETVYFANYSNRRVIKDIHIKITHIHVHARIHIHVRTSTHAHTHTRMHTHTHAHTLVWNISFTKLSWCLTLHFSLKFSMIEFFVGRILLNYFSELYKVNKLCILEFAVRLNDGKLKLMWGCNKNIPLSDRFDKISIIRNIVSLFN